ncbi:uncharacterized protein [Rutidosis leptorrhynchoides]|uniref:uncharacterized protein n=1 Tax=Rutidosis leptorrhynchoides TaxID=125765 RepID=UPI003A9959E5
MTCNVCVHFVSAHLWHARLGHPPDQVLKVLKNKLDIKDFKENCPCDIFQKAKQTMEPFPLGDHKSQGLGDLIHLDLWGPFKIQSREGYKYFLTIVDDFSRAVWTFLLKTKEDTFDNIQSFINLIKNQFNKNVKIIRSDNGTEFVNNKMNNFIKLNGIVHQTSCAYTPQQSGIAERKHMHLLNVANALIFQGDIKRLNDEGRTAYDDEGSSTSGYINKHSPTRNNPSSSDNVTNEGKVKYGIEKVVNHSFLNQENKCFTSNLNKSYKLKTYFEASKDSNWVEAMNQEIKALNRNNTWIIADLPANRKPIGFLLNDKGICMNQRKYCLELLNDYGMLWCKPFGTPVEPNLNVESEPNIKDPLLKNVTEYQKLVGAPGKGVQFVKSDSFKLYAYSDSDYAKCKLNKKSVTGKKQATVSRSSTEAEYRAMASTASLQLAANPIFHERTKYFEVDVHYIRRKVDAGVINTLKIVSDCQLADILTKG